MKTLSMRLICIRYAQLCNADEITGSLKLDLYDLKNLQIH